MKSRTVVCVYGKNESVEKVMERLNALYVSNYSKNYLYGAIIDLPDAISYRVSGDIYIEEQAQKLVATLSARYGRVFFCAIRQRRIRADKEYRYACEDGELGALRALWRCAKGKGTELFPFFGRAELSGAERVYFSGECWCGNAQQDNALSKGYIDVIEPNGIFGLAAHLKESEAVFAFTGAMEDDLSVEKYRKTEGLFCAEALDKLLSSEAVPYKSAICARIGVVRYPEKSFGVFSDEKVLL